MSVHLQHNQIYSYRCSLAPGQYRWHLHHSREEDLLDNTQQLTCPLLCHALCFALPSDSLIQVATVSKTSENFHCPFYSS